MDKYEVRKYQNYARNFMNILIILIVGFVIGNIAGTVYQFNRFGLNDKETISFLFSNNITVFILLDFFILGMFKFSKDKLEKVGYIFYFVLIFLMFFPLRIVNYSIIDFILIIILSISVILTIGYTIFHKLNQLYQLKH